MTSQNSWNNQVTAAAVTLNGGVTNIGTDAAANAINIGTGAAAKTITVGNTTGATAVNVNTGTGDFALDSATGTLMTALDTGEITKPLQPAFLGVVNANDLNVTGDGTIFTLGSGNALTIVFDQNSDFVNTGTFTAPVTGKYTLSGGISSNGLTAAATLGVLRFLTSNRTYTGGYLNVGAVRDSSNRTGLVFSALVDMDAADTATFTFVVTGTSKTIDVDYSGDVRSFFSGSLLC